MFAYKLLVFLQFICYLLLGSTCALPMFLFTNHRSPTKTRRGWWSGENQNRSIRQNTANTQLILSENVINPKRVQLFQTLGLRFHSAASLPLCVPYTTIPPTRSPCAKFNIAIIIIIGVLGTVTVIPVTEFKCGIQFLLRFAVPPTAAQREPDRP